MRKAIMIVSGDSWNSSSYCRLHGPIIEDILWASGYEVSIYWVYDPNWSISQILEISPALLVTLKAEGGRSNQLKSMLGKAGVPVISALNINPTPAKYPVSLTGVRFATAAVLNGYLKTLLNESSFAADHFRLIDDPPDTWLPDPAERSNIRARLPAHPRRLIWIGRARHLQSLEKYSSAIPDGWQLDIWTDKPEQAKLKAHRWDPAMARASLASADAMLITAKNDNSAPIRLISGLQSGCPVLAEPLTSYLEAVPKGHGWLALNSPECLTKILNKWEQEPELTKRLAQHISVLPTDALRAEHKAAWEQLINEAIS